MSFDRARLPDPQGYFVSTGLLLRGPSKWKTTACTFHGGSDSLRVNTGSGAWVCMSCGAKGGDVLAYHMQAHGLEFSDAAKALGCWVEDGKPQRPQRPAPLPPRAALQVIGFEASLAAVAAANVAQGRTLTEPDRFRLLAAAARISRLVEAYA